ncbi:hypothetical protein C7E18_06760 [Stenotrophomonas maltophilia]|nr:hypothetical protein C7E18_06760 [Stenotrophomonas maltophilia]
MVRCSANVAVSVRIHPRMAWIYCRARDPFTRWIHAMRGYGNPDKKKWEPANGLPCLLHAARTGS